DVLRTMLRRRLPLDSADLLGMIESLRRLPNGHELAALPVTGILAHVERLGTGSALPVELREPLAALRALALSGPYQTADQRKLVIRIEEMLADGPHAVFEGGERWVDALIAELNALPAAEKRAWTELCVHLLSASATAPSAKWLKEGARLRDAIGAEALRDRALSWIAAARDDTQQPVLPRNADFLRGLIWCVAEWTPAAEQPRTASLLGDVALAMARKLPNIGMRSVKALNACITTLGRMPGTEPLAQLTRLRAKVKSPRPQALIGATLEEAARRQGTAVADLEELVTPTFGMDDVGVLRERFGDWTAELRIAGTDTVELRWLRGDGKAQKSPPAEVQREHADEVKELKATAQEMAKMLPAQRDRIERLPLEERVLPLDAWRERYLHHPLVGPLSRRLIWHFSDGRRSALGAWRDGAMVGADDEPLDWMGADTQVRLWHPIGFDVETVRRWREWLERHEVVQPFKQAHREVYILTDAELATETYSNRFAAHIVRQHQFAALCRARGWRYALQGGFDNANVPALHLERYRLRAEFWVEPCLGGEQTLTEMGIALYASTDQLRFLDDHGQPLPLREVPALVFSEVMRDVDLFVGVASVGADPMWENRGERPEWNGYWREYSFGDLSATAQTRRQVLERLIPRLKIAGRCRLEGKFLVVRGDLRTYKIHLGSGNILMEPNDQYLCIVPDRSGAGRARGNVWLPFEGDGTMSVILSKAFLLADDTRITDETILRQLRA
ncbi:MAG TPA: DUF4132 domain-containing protein, partial [Gemmatimonadaceae bacterium]|nr:DUF4132 domain-containing protein [Gemmatimonadaceae bacterium]